MRDITVKYYNSNVDVFVEEVCVSLNTESDVEDDEDVEHYIQCDIERIEYKLGIELTDEEKEKVRFELTPYYNIRMI